MADRTVTTTATGLARAVPDAVSVALVIEVEGATPAEALEACGAVQAAVIEVLGVTASAAGLSVQPGWDAERNRPGKPTASARITAQLPDLADAGRVVTGALEAGGRPTRLESLSPVVSAPGEAVAAAREAAFSNARAAAEQYAALAGTALGTVLEVAEGVRAGARGVAAMPGGAKRLAMESYDVAGGAQDVSVTVTVTWELDD